MQVHPLTTPRRQLEGDIAPHFASDDSRHEGTTIREELTGLTLTEAETSLIVSDHPAAELKHATLHGWQVDVRLIDRATSRLLVVESVFSGLDETLPASIVTR